MKRRRRLIVVSPHLDDAVFGCGQLIAAHPGTLVVTVFAGVPQPSAPLPEWDAACGFDNARRAMVARRQEDREALELLCARPRWLDLYDSQYGRRYAVDQVSEGLREALWDERAEVLAVPLGLFHEDHRLASIAALQLLDRPFTWIAYEDALYRRVPGLVERRLAALRAGGFAFTPFQAEAGEPRLKARAIDRYASQLRGLATPGRPGHGDLGAPERYWRISA